MAARISVDEAVLRYVGTYGMGGKVLFDAQERRLIHKDDVMNLLPSHGWDLLKSHPQWRVVRDHEIGFDPTEIDKAVKCNLYGGWPTQPKPGTCTALLDLLMYLCGNEPNREQVYWWLLCWLAYPIQHPGAKMHSAIVVHGPQGTGKSRFFEAYGKIFGPYGRVLGQEALEDKFNADWAEKKLFILADEVLARQDMFHIKNRLKGFITGDTIRVNPKNIAAHNEKNQMNIVFLSNERMPLVLENDDRRCRPNSATNFLRT
jgi:putative DNA primase/helicase